MVATYKIIENHAYILIIASTSCKSRPTRPLCLLNWYLSIYIYIQLFLRISILSFCT